jgi:hypothetical protein
METTDLENALLVMVLTPGIRAFLTERDPMALAQAERALRASSMAARSFLDAAGCCPDEACGNAHRDDDQDDDDDSWSDDDGLTDVEADAMTLASAGWGTDEDYNHWDGGEDF